MLAANTLARMMDRAHYYRVDWLKVFVWIVAPLSIWAVSLFLVLRFIG